MTAVSSQDKEKSENLTPDALLFAEKAARSVSEIQDGANNIADIVVFLEILGYDDKVATENGFSSIMALSKHIYNFIEFYDESRYSRIKQHQLLAKQDSNGGNMINNSELLKKNYGKTLLQISNVITVFGKNKDDSAAEKATQDGNVIVKEKKTNEGEIPIPSIRKRIAEALSLQSPWLTALLMLNITGFSLWMVQELPADITIAFISGVFLGLVFTEGPFQMFSRLLFSSYEQKNIGEFKRTMQRTYAVIGTMLIGMIGLVIITAIYFGLPLELAIISSAAAVSISLHRASFMPLYVLKKFKGLMISYAAAFLTLMAVYFLFPIDTIPTDITGRYFVSLGAAFGILGGFAAFYHYQIFKEVIGRKKVLDDSIPSFYSPPEVIYDTIKSRFSIQVWESIPYLLFGTLYFVIIFGDRVLSWMLNNHVLLASNGALLPFAFNSEYHAGADMALLVLIPVAIVQYIVIAPIHAMISNKMASMRVLELDSLNNFLKHRYSQLIFASLIATAIPALILNALGDQIIEVVRGSDASVQIMRYASVANVLLSVFIANSQFLMLLNKAKIPIIIAAGAAAIIILGGWIAGQQEPSNIVFSYLVGAAVSAGVSTLFVIRSIKNGAMQLLSRYA